MKRKPEIEQKLAQKIIFTEPIEYRVTIMIGTMYLIKVDTGLTQNYLHLETYTSPSGETFLVQMTENNMRNDPLFPLVWRE